MDDYCCSISVGDTVPDFTVKTFDPSENDFGQFNLKANMKAKKWSILFFYPAGVFF